MLVDLKHRSDEHELMDDPKIEESALKRALSDISRVNKWLGGNIITINAVQNLIKQAKQTQEYTILDLGCGDGEMLRELAIVLRKKRIQTKLIGLDLNEKSIQYAKNLSSEYPEIEFLQQNILDINSSKFTCDIIICTLTLHHLTCEEIKQVIKKTVELASIGVVVNDLQRSKIAYYLFKLFSFFFINGYVAKNDGLISIKRGFRKQELKQYAKDLRLKAYQIDWKWAFRYRWVIHTKYI